MNETFPRTIKVLMCANHGPYIDQNDDGQGCPTQVNYAGITCARNDGFESYVLDCGW